MENLKGKKNIKLYHGSDVIVGQPEYGKGKLNNDYGIKWRKDASKPEKTQSGR